MTKFSRHNTRSAKLTAAQVLELRQKYAAGMSQSELSREFQVTIGTIGRIVRGESWQNFQRITPPAELTDRAMQSQERMRAMLAADELTPGVARFAEEAAKLPGAVAARELDEFINPKAAEKYLGVKANGNTADDKGPAGDSGTGTLETVDPTHEG